MREDERGNGEKDGENTEDLASVHGMRGIVGGEADGGEKENPLAPAEVILGQRVGLHLPNEIGAELRWICTTSSSSLFRESPDATVVEAVPGIACPVHKSALVDAIVALPSGCRKPVKADGEMHERGNAGKRKV